MFDVTLMLVRLIGFDFDVGCLGVYTNVGLLRFSGLLVWVVMLI